MSLWPDDPEKRWNTMIVGAILVFGVWVTLVVLGQIFGDNADVKDDALLIGAAATLLTVLLGNFRHGQKLDEIEKQMNGKNGEGSHR